MTSAFRPEITDALAAADRLVRPWLTAGDTWRKDRDGLPEQEDIVVALARLRGLKRSDSLRFDLTFRAYAYVVSERGAREEYDALTLPEALLLMLADELRRACAECRECDGHDVRCSVLAAELAEEEVA